LYWSKYWRVHWLLQFWQSSFSLWAPKMKWENKRSITYSHFNEKLDVWIHRSYDSQTSWVQPEAEKIGNQQYYGFWSFGSTDWQVTIRAILIYFDLQSNQWCGGNVIHKHQKLGKSQRPQCKKTPKVLPWINGLMMLVMYWWEEGWPFYRPLPTSCKHGKQAAVDGRVWLPGSSCAVYTTSSPPLDASILKAYVWEL
jgi:hypothetical protein